MKRSPIGPGAEAIARGSSFKPRSSELSPGMPKRNGSTLSAGKGFAVSPAQREHVRGRKCAVVECFTEECDPAHLIGRGFMPDLSGDPRAVIPLCREHHRLYDDGKLSLVEHLEPSHRAEVAYAVELVGLITALHLISNQRWAPESEAA